MSIWCKIYIMEQAIFSLLSQFNWVDVIFLTLSVYFMITSGGFINTFLEALGFILSLALTYKFYSLFGKLLVYLVEFPRGIANAVGFFIAWFLIETLLFVLIHHVSQFIFKDLRKHPLNNMLGFVAGAVQAVFIFIFFISLVFAFPVRGKIKKDILESKVGPHFVNLSQSFELQLKRVFGEAIQESINFMTVRPASNEMVSLGIANEEKKLSVDSASEEVMLNLINNERERMGLKTVQIDFVLRGVSREYATEMFANDFFSHTSKVDGSSPADRAERKDAVFTVLGENLAYAPDVYIAHQGLMNSEGHRKNILSEEYSRVGIGVVDGGHLGKMFVQEFAD